MATLEVAGLLLGVHGNGKVALFANQNADLQAWTASAEQIQLVRKALALAQERRPHFWSSVFTSGQLAQARAIALRVDCQVADFEPLGAHLTLGDANPAHSSGLVRIHQDGGVIFAKVVEGRMVEEPWRATQEQIECVRQALRRRQGER